MGRKPKEGTYQAAVAALKKRRRSKRGPKKNAGLTSEEGTDGIKPTEKEMEEGLEKQRQRFAAYESSHAGSVEGSVDKAYETSHAGSVDESLDESTARSADGSVDKVSEPLQTSDTPSITSLFASTSSSSHRVRSTRPVPRPKIANAVGQIKEEDGIRRALSRGIFVRLTQNTYLMQRLTTNLKLRAKWVHVYSDFVEGTSDDGSQESQSVGNWFCDCERGSTQCLHIQTVQRYLTSISPISATESPVLKISSRNLKYTALSVSTKGSLRRAIVWKTSSGVLNCSMHQGNQYRLFGCEHRSRVEKLEEALSRPERDSESESDESDTSNDDGIIVEIIVPRSPRRTRSRSPEARLNVETQADLSSSSQDDTDLEGTETFSDELFLQDVGNNQPTFATGTGVEPRCMNADHTSTPTCNTSAQNLLHDVGGVWFRGPSPAPWRRIMKSRQPKIWSKCPYPECDGDLAVLKGYRIVCYDMRETTEAKLDCIQCKKCKLTVTLKHNKEPWGMGVGMTMITCEVIWHLQSLFVEHGYTFTSFVQVMEKVFLLHGIRTNIIDI